MGDEAPTSYRRITVTVRTSPVSKLEPVGKASKPPHFQRSLGSSLREASCLRRISWYHTGIFSVHNSLLLDFPKTSTRRPTSHTTIVAGTFGQRVSLMILIVSTCNLNMRQPW
jgi:hypothetical protein